MSVITCPPCKERGGVEIRYDRALIGVKPDTFLEKRGPAFTFFRLKDGKEIASVPYRDRDAIFSHADDEPFVETGVGPASIHRHVSHARSTWIVFARTDLEIKFLRIPSV